MSSAKKVPSRPLSYKIDKLKELPTKPGVYLFKDGQGSVIYVGKAKSLRRRVTSYFTKQPDLKTRLLLDRATDFNYQVAPTEMAALLLEDSLIKKYKPRYNIALRDDKAYPFLKLTVNETWPRLLLVRRREGDGAKYFGPFQGGMVREIIRLTKKIFPLRWCKGPLKKREQPCLYYRIGVCAGPCVGKIDQAEYRLVVAGVKELLEGNFDSALAKLDEEMRQAAAKQDFEWAAQLRDRVAILQKMLEGKPWQGQASQVNLVALHELKEGLKLKKLPLRIEAFDVSNIQGSNIVGAMVVFVNGAPFKQDYRRFKIKHLVGQPNDVAALYEMIGRRYQGGLTRGLPLPDLVLVDGGKPQLKLAKAALSLAGLKDLPLVGLAKKQEELFLPHAIKPCHFSPRSLALLLLQRVRDEAHRFAIAYHRQRRDRALYQ